MGMLIPKKMRRVWDAMMRQSFDPGDWFAGAGDGDGQEADRRPRVTTARGGEGRKVWVYDRIYDPQTQTYRWEVGFYDPDRRWHAESRHPTPEEAAARVRWLNGGN